MPRKAPARYQLQLGRLWSPGQGKIMQKLMGEIDMIYSSVIKHGLLENPPFMDELPIETSIQFGDFPSLCLITTG